MSSLLRIILLVLATTVVSMAAAQDNGQLFNATVDSSTRWAFRTVSPVTVTSPIVRLGDVVQPIDPNQAGWQRLGRAAIGLVPVSGEAMTIRRDRLNKVILSAEATPRAIDWHGPTEIHIVYRKPNPNETIHQVAYQNSDAGEVVANSTEPQLSSVDAQRVIHWIELSLARFYPDVAEAYQIEVNKNQVGLTSLQYLSGVSHMEAVGPIAEGTSQFLIVARTGTGPTEAQVEIVLTAHPRLVVPTRSLGRGKRIEAADLEMKPFPPDQIDPQFVADIESLIGQEVRSPLQSGRPIAYDAIGSPILVHRGDLIEVRVIGGGVTVTTNAKALGDGAESDLIEIETLNPRKRLIARVAAQGSVEIITRAPIIR